MTSRLRLLLIPLLLPAALFSQTAKDSPKKDSTFSILFNISTVFYTAKDARINNFLTKYGYVPPQDIPVGVNLEVAALPFNSKMMYSINMSTVVSRQAIVSSFFKLAAYRSFFERQHFFASAGLGAGLHGSRIVLNGKMPPSFDSLANATNEQLVLRRTGFFLEPGLRTFWYPIHTRRFELGLFANIAYDFAFNHGWKLGYYNNHGQYASFKSLGKTSAVQTHHEFGWAFSTGLSFRFKFD